VAGLERALEREQVVLGGRVVYAAKPFEALRPAVD